MHEPSSAARAGLLTKRSLVIASHAVEHAALADIDLGDAVVIAMFQRLPYFDREREVYAKIAARAAVTVVGMVDQGRPDLPPGVTPVLLRPDEWLSREWSVVVLSPTFGASVIAHDLEDVDGQGVSLESSRLFRGRWGMRRDEAYAEVVRLRDLLSDRLPPMVRQRIDATLNSVLSPAALDIEQRAEAALRHVSGRLQVQREEAARAIEQVRQERGHGRDPGTGLHTLASIEPWVGVAADTVSLGLTLVRVDELADVHARFGTRAGIHTEHNIAELLRHDLRPLDRAVRIRTEEFLLIQPAVTERVLDDTGRQINDRLSSLQATYPFVELNPSIASTLTRRRPLPLPALRAQLPAVAHAPVWPRAEPAPPRGHGRTALATRSHRWFG
ncbi:sensor protein [Amycolatopsis antarctica]|uniref:Sensor protein n=1 Tax=Amycolatopsis antarctica TaxID=1854586 RepID=A0A263D7F2_9PSEU|nr:DICT sensory domain-containing protein [Amycolatopsis antarctica]OZM73416.1 sensor protein [Amycolatopsis antarctica]